MSVRLHGFVQNHVLSIGKCYLFLLSDSKNEESADCKNKIQFSEGSDLGSRVV